MATAIRMPLVWTLPSRLAGTPGRRQRRQPGNVPADHAEILDKHDDRLIRDIGLEREDILGPQAGFWRDREKQKTVWQL